MARDDGSRRILELVRQDEAVLLQRWVAMAVAPLQGRLTPAELAPVFGELLATLTTALDKGDLDIRSDNYAGPRALLAEVSRDWARRGFTSTETASSVFSLKETLFALADGAGEPHQTVIAISRWVDTLGLYTFEAFTRAREQVITEQADQLLELTTPVVKLWDGVVAVPLIGTWIRPAPRLSWRNCCRRSLIPDPSTRSSTSPVFPRWTPKSPSTCSRRWSRPG